MHTLTQLHIDIARNATDDFNLFHDPMRWQRISENPFQGTIALGFQLGLYVETQINRSEPAIKWRQCSVYEFTFVNPAKVGDELNLVLKRTRVTETDKGEQESQRLILKASGKPSLMGSYRQSDFMSVDSQLLKYSKEKLSRMTDRTLFDNSVFLKRKWMIVGNVKNYLLSAFADQTQYIDEFVDKVRFPHFYPLSLMSSAMLERAQALEYDLIQNPMIYVSQNMCIDNQQLAQLKSNDCLNILVAPVDTDPNHLTCVGWVDDESPLFCAEVKLMPLSDMLIKPA
ncbi:hypothetical protein [Alteromonas sp. S005]|uniref:hypothetical protein n=1 Tax=Alteromonas sp. S005 TaxID=3117400 RepID=UPI002FE04601